MNLNLNTFSLKGKGLYISQTIEPLCLWYRKKTLMCFDLTLKHTRSSDSLVSKASVRDLLVRPYSILDVEETNDNYDSFTISYYIPGISYYIPGLSRINYF